MDLVCRREIINNGVQLFLLTLGRIPYNKALEQQLWEKLDRSFTFVESELKKKTFLVGHRVTLADLTLASDLAMIFARIGGVNFRSKYPNTVRYFKTVTGQPQLLPIFKNFTFAEENAKFVPPKKERKPKAAAAPKAEKPKAAPAPKADDEDDEPKPAPKPKNPLYDLPKSSFNWTSGSVPTRTRTPAPSPSPGSQELRLGRLHRLPASTTSTTTSSRPSSRATTSSAASLPVSRLRASTPWAPSVSLVRTTTT